jgi:hypothetical protein
MSFDYTRIRRGEMIAAISALVLFVVMFLTWFNFTGDRRTRFLIVAGGHPLPVTGTAWHAFSNTSLLLVLLVLVALAPAVVTATQQKLNFPLAAVLTGLSIVVAALVIYKLFGHRPGGNKYTGVAVGGYLGLVAIIGITVGAFMTALEDGVSWGDPDRPPSVADAGEPAEGAAASVNDPASAPEPPPRAEE